MEQKKFWYAVELSFNHRHRLFRINKITCMSRTLCPLPFSHQHVQPNGEIRFCCAARSDSNKRADNQTYNVNHDKLKDAWNSESIKKLRLDLINGQTPEACQYCWERESDDHTKGTSMRIDFLDRIPIDTISDRVEFAKHNNGFLDHNPFDFQVMSGNLCNLSCKMCTPQYSTSWSKFYSNKGTTAFNQIKFSKHYQSNIVEEKHFNKTYDWPNTHPLKSILGDYLNDIRSIFLIGGEPTLIDGTFDFLEHMIDLNYQDKLYPWISTNCTNINQNLITLLDQFSRTGMNLSLDGMDDIAYLQRTPSNWNQIQTNVDKLMDWSQTRKKTKYTNLNIHSVITSMNLHHIGDFWKYLIDRYSTKDFTISFMPILEKFDNFSVSIIPTEQANNILHHTKNLALSVPRKYQSVFEKLIYTIETTEFSPNYDNIQYQLAQLQNYHPEIDIKKIYSIYYNDSL